MRASFLSIAMVVALVLATTTDATSQELITDYTPPPVPRVELSEVIASLEAGTIVRVQLFDGRLLEGRYSGTVPGRIFLQGESGPMPLALSEVTTIWTKGRATRKGAVYGAWLGGLSTGAFLAFAVSAFGGDDDISEVGAFFVGGFLGGSGGAATGALIGAALPRWRLFWGEDRGFETAPTYVREHHDSDRAEGTGLITLSGGSARSLNDGIGEGSVFQGSLTSPWGSHVRHGLEYMYASSLTPKLNDASWISLADSDRRIQTIGYRIEIAPIEDRPGKLTPFLVLGLGAYNWVDAYVGASIGAGLRWRESPDSFGLIAEIRRHEGIQNLTESDPAHMTATLGFSFGW